MNSVPQRPQPDPDAGVRWRRFGSAMVLALALPGTGVAAGQGETVPPRGADVDDGVYDEYAGGDLEFQYENGVSGRYFLPEITCGGAALVDYDGDGDLDVYFVQGGTLEPSAEAGAPSDRLFRNDLVLGAEDPRLDFVDVTARARVTDTEYGCGVAAGDYDGDGHIDLYVANLGSNRLLRNRGDGSFDDVTARAGAGDDRWSTSATFTDYDGDGLLDLFVVNYVVFDPADKRRCRTAAGAPDYCDPKVYTGVPNRLLRNRGDGTFEDVSGASGVGAARGKSLGTVAADFDDDGRTDLYVANDGEPNELWLQKGAGRFEESALLAGVAVNADGHPEAGMGVVAEDFDGDGDVDLFLTHLTGETHTLYRHEGDGLFRDITVRSGLAGPSVPYTSWGVAWTDYDNDGWLDLAIVNGAVRTLPELAARDDPYPFHQRDQLFRDRGRNGEPGRYVDVTAEAGAGFARSAVSRGMAVGDVDNDGDEDLLVVDAGGPARLLLNRMGQDRHWLGLRLVAGGPPRDQVGTQVALLDAHGATVATRRVATDGGYASAHDARVVFGLGEDDGARRVRLRWSDGRIRVFAELQPDHYTVLRRRAGEEDP